MGEYDIAKQYPLLSLVVKEFTKLQAGGSLLPDLIEFYIWLHQDLNNVVSECYAKNKKLGDVLVEYGDNYHCALFQRVKGKDICVMLSQLIFSSFLENHCRMLCSKLLNCWTHTYSNG